MRSPISAFRKDVSTDRDAGLVLAVGLSTFILCGLLLLDSESVLLILFLIGAAFPIAVCYLAVVGYLFVRMLRRRDTWLLLFSVMSAMFIVFVTWLLSAGIVSHRELSKLFMFGAIPYALLSMALGIAMLRGSSGVRPNAH